MATAAHAHAPALFTTAPVFAIRELLEKCGWSVADVDLFEVNEAFAAVAMIAMRDLDIPHDRISSQRSYGRTPADHLDLLLAPPARPTSLGHGLLAVAPPAYDTVRP